MFSPPSAALLNHLLAQNAWAIARLKPFAGKTARFEVAPFVFGFTVSADGTLHDSDDAVPPDAHCVIPPSLLPRLAAREVTAESEVVCEGEDSLLAEIFYLSRNLRWDAAEDLSKVTGDVAAERIVQLIRTSHRQFFEGITNVAEAVSEYLTEERTTLASRHSIAAFLTQVDTLREDFSRLEQRVGKIAKCHAKQVAGSDN